MRIWLLAVLAIGSPASVQAAPTYLKCVLTNNDGKPLDVNIQLNEEGGTATTSFPIDSTSQTYKASFSTTEVSFDSWKVSRTDLMLARHNGDWGPPPVSYGKCVLDKRTRAF